MLRHKESATYETDASRLSIKGSAKRLPACGRQVPRAGLKLIAAMPLLF